MVPNGRFNLVVIPYCILKTLQFDSHLKDHFTKNMEWNSFFYTLDCDQFANIVFYQFIDDRTAKRKY